MQSQIGSDAQYEEEIKKHRAKNAVDTILAAEQHKNDKDLKPHIDAELKERHGHLKSAMKDDKKKVLKSEKKKEAPKKVAPAKKSAGKKK